MKSIEEKITAILQDLGLWDVRFSLPLDAQIDSLDLTAIIVAIEDEHGIEITDEDRYNCNTMDDYVALIQSKLIAKNRVDTLKEAGMLTYPESPPIEDQIKFIEDFVVDPHMKEAIRSNLEAIRLQQQIRHAAKIDSNAMVYSLTGNITHVHRFDPQAPSMTAGKFCLDCGQLILEGINERYY